MKALIVEGDRLKRRFLAKVLGARGFEPGECEDDERAIECVRRTPVPLVLIGHDPPRLDGFDLCRRLRTNPTTSDAVLVVAAWANGPAPDPIAVTESGIDDFVSEAAKLDLLELRLAIAAARVRRSTRGGGGRRLAMDAGVGVTEGDADTSRHRDFLAGMTLASILEDPGPCAAGGIRWEPVSPEPGVEDHRTGSARATSDARMGPFREKVTDLDTGKTPESEEPAIPATGRAVSPSRSPRRPRNRVLVADQNPVYRKVTARMLTDLGCQVDVASSGPEAVALAAAVTETPRYDIVFVDCQLAGMNAGEITAEIHRRQPQGPLISIIAVTAHATRGEREHCLTAGASGYLSRPVTKDDLRAVLARWGRARFKDGETELGTPGAGSQHPYRGSPRAMDLAP